MLLKRHRTSVILILLRSAAFAVVAFLILRWTWGRGMLPVGVGSGAAIATILIDLSRQVGKTNQLDASLELTRPDENNHRNEVTVEAIENKERE